MQHAIGLCLLVGCVGEASVSYQGTVVEAATSGYGFATAPGAGVAVVNAVVELCIEGTCNKRTVVGADGTYPLIEQAFGGFAGDDTDVLVRVTATDGRTTSYRTTFESTRDPTIANPSCATPCPPNFLNFTLAPP